MSCPCRDAFQAEEAIGAAAQTGEVPWVFSGVFGVQGLGCMYVCMYIYIYLYLYIEVPCFLPV